MVSKRRTSGGCYHKYKIKTSCAYHGVSYQIYVSFKLLVHTFCFGLYTLVRV